MRPFIYLLGFVFCCMNCEKAFISSAAITPQFVFDEMWRELDENYIYFDVKSVDWDSIYNVYAPRVQADISDEDLFNVCVEMLEELRDGHNSLFSPATDDVKYPFKEGFPIFFDLEIIKSEYLNDDFKEIGNYTFGMLQNDIAYVYFRDFEKVRDITEVMSFVNDNDAKALIFDIRNNGGGVGQDAEDIISYFINSPQTVGFIVEKTGPNRDDISENLSITAEPTDFFFEKPVHFLMNRGSYSASTYLAAMIKDLPQVKTIGQITGGGGGGNNSFYLPNGWVLTMSVNKLLDTNLEEVEEGIEPDIEIINDSLSLVNRTDLMLEKAIEEF